MTMNDREPNEPDESYAARILADMVERWNLDRNAAIQLIRHLRWLLKG